MSSSLQLAAVMFADIMGFTAIMHEDEALALQLREKLKRKLEAETSLHGGRIIKFSSDGALCSFDSAGESVRAAMAVQLSMQQEPKVPVRISIHQADVVFEEGGVHDDEQVAAGNRPVELSARGKAAGTDAEWKI
jgi:class 3 adenylate cyclase